jgi:hypothetical protein
MPLPPVISIDIPCVTGGPLHVADAAALAEVFFSTEISSLGPRSYDARTLSTHSERLDREDITVLNASFRAMIIKVSLWEPLLAAADLPWLAALGRDWDMITMSDAQLAEHGILDSVEAAITEIVSVKGRGIAQATKVLHLKRPRLVPVVDSFVARALGGRLSVDGPAERRVAQTRVILEHMRAAGQQVFPQLEEVDAHLRSVGIERSLVRILDALVWCSEAEAWVAMADLIARWRT